VQLLEFTQRRPPNARTSRARPAPDDGREVSALSSHLRSETPTAPPSRWSLFRLIRAAIAARLSGAIDGGVGDTPEPSEESRALAGARGCGREPRVGRPDIGGVDGGRDPNGVAVRVGLRVRQTAPSKDQISETSDRWVPTFETIRVD